MGGRIHLWLIHVDVYQKLSQYCKVFSDFKRLSKRNSRSKFTFTLRVCVCVCVCVCVQAHAQTCPNLYGPMECSLLGSSVYGIFQARILD